MCAKGSAAASRGGEFVSSRRVIGPTAYAPRLVFRTTVINAFRLNVKDFRLGTKTHSSGRVKEGLGSRFRGGSKFSRSFWRMACFVDE